jgi:NAD(P)-dependent dehydrogenase (short-subunit alcohol dehydrogenase family)
MNLNQKIAVVTGASAGLGVAFARALVAEGARVFGLARRQEKLDAVHRELGDAFTGLPCDVRDEADVRRAFDTIARDAGRVDVLVNNAGLGGFGPVEEMDAEQMDRQLDTNVRGLVLCTQQAIPLMKRQNAESGFGGHVVNVASVAGLVGNANLSIYNATKFAVRGLSEAWMKELRHDGIKVTCLYPGTVNTDFFETAGTTQQGKGMHADDLAATLVHVLRAPDDYLISEVVMRPLRP